jgi:hypothetical protein
MINPLAFAANVRAALPLLRKPELRDGAVSECGCWRGGMAATLVELGGADRDYYFFDSFEGLPPARLEVDGAAAVKYQADTSSPS